MNTFKADIEEIRRRAREKMDDGAVTASYQADRDQVIEVLNEVLATEIVCTLRYRNHYFMAKGIHSEPASSRSSSSTPTRSSCTPTWSPSGSPSSAAGRTSTPEGLATRSHAEYGDVATRSRR